MVDEGARWDTYDTRAGARHARLWRLIQNKSVSLGRLPPTFTWCPSHLELERVAIGYHPGANFDHVIGNMWADYFAKLGAKSIGYSTGYVDYFKHAFAQAKMFARFLGFTLCRLFQQQLWEDGRPTQPKVREVKPTVTVMDHEFWYSEQHRVWRCRGCGVFARSEVHLGNLSWGTHRHCRPTALQSAQASTFFGSRKGLTFAPLREEAVHEALQAADIFLGQADALPVPVAADSDAALGQISQHFAELGHAMLWNGLACVCTRCARTSTDVTRRIWKLKETCPGAAQTKEVRKNQIATILRFARRHSVEFMDSVRGQLADEAFGDGASKGQDGENLPSGKGATLAGLAVGAPDNGR